MLEVFQEEENVPDVRHLLKRRVRCGRSWGIKDL
jgi:hypothetical protein